MAADKQQPALADYVAIAISPAFIMTLVGSLVFFLLEVVYVGQYGGRLQWIMFFFVFAAVLIARMSMTPGIAERAGLYGLVLAIVVFIALQKFVDYHPDSPLHHVTWLVNLGLMGIIWWSAYKLTWDCTLIDENVDSSGAGLLDVAGLEGSGNLDGEERAELDEPGAGKHEMKGVTGWWLRYCRYRDEQRRQPHAPGVWIVYFSLAALPIFGLGQSLIPPGEEERRRYVFWLMAIYVASALGLLLTTSFLGLRRYLRQRNLQMPVAMTGTWLTMGGSLIVALLVLGAVLPRPHPEYPLVNVVGLAGSPDRDASQWAPKGAKPGQGQGRPGAEGPKEGQEGTSGPGNPSGKPGGQKPGSSGSGSSKGDGSGQGQNQSGNGQAKPGQDSSGSSTKPGSQPNSSGNDRPGESGQSGGAPEKPPPKPGEHQPNNQSDSAKDDGSPREDSGPSKLKELFAGLMKVLKWLVFVVAAVIAAFLVLRALLKFLANFTDWAKSLLASLQGLWQSLFGWWGQSATGEVADTQEAEKPLPRPFSSFQNPFTNGGGDRSPEELVRYSFEALEAWAWERGYGRDPDDTPLEFGERLGEETPAVAADARRLGALYARVAYSRGALPAESVGFLRRFWQRLDTTADARIPTR
jgi:hypothetical protein